MRSDRELFRLAKDMVFIEERLSKTYDEFTKEELLQEADKIRNILLEKHYDMDTFLQFQEMYKSMSIAEYYEFIDTLG